MPRTLVLYFSATSTTRGVAEVIGRMYPADLHEIKPVKPYSPQDLDWHDNQSRSSQEQQDASARPDFVHDLPDTASYDLICLGFPIWWDEAPRVIDTLVTSGYLDGKTVVPFATSGSSGIANAQKRLQSLSNAVRWRSGELLTIQNTYGFARRLSAVEPGR